MAAGCKKSGKGIGITGAAASAVFVALAAYVIYQFILAGQAEIKTVMAQFVTVDDGISVSGIIARDETVLTGASGKSYSLLVSNGERVSKGQTIAALFRNEPALEASMNARSLSDKLTELEQFGVKTGQSVNMAEYNRSIYENLRELAEAAGNGCFEELDKNESKLSELVLGRQYAIYGMEGYFKRVEEQKSELKKLGASSPSGSFQSMDTGYYSSVVDGFESGLTLAMTNSITTEAFEKRAQNAEDLSSGVGTYGKLITDYRWRFLTTVTVEESKRLTLGYTYILKMADRELQCTLIRFGGESGGRVLLVFESEDAVSEMSVYRKLSAVIVLKSYTGLKVPAEALRIVGGTKGVYCLEGAQAQFKEVDIVFEGGTYFVSAPDPSKKKLLFRNAEIILGIKELYDGKIVR